MASPVSGCHQWGGVTGTISRRGVSTPTLRLRDKSQAKAQTEDKAEKEDKEGKKGKEEEEEQEEEEEEEDANDIHHSL